MSIEAHHRDALIETARSELDRAHRAALALEAGELRRGLQLAIAALREAGDEQAALEPLDKALADLDSGALTEMVAIIEAVRVQLARDPAA